MYPKRFGQIEIANGAFPNLNTAEEFVNAVKNRGIVGVGDGKMFTISELKKSGRIAYFSKWQKNNN